MTVAGHACGRGQTPVEMTVVGDACVRGQTPVDMTQERQAGEMKEASTPALPLLQDRALVLWEIGPDVELTLGKLRQELAVDQRLRADQSL